MKYILAIDQGTSSTKSLVFDEAGIAVASGTEMLNTHYYDNGYVEQDAKEIIENVRKSVSKCLHNFLQGGGKLQDVVACGISNQRETFIIWDKGGNPFGPAVVWACKRSVQTCKELISRGENELVRQKTGLIIDPYFSATKLIHLLESREDLRKRMERGELYFGTVDTWLLYQFTNGKQYSTDHTNAHRTLLFNIHSLSWDRELLDLWGLSSLNLPKVQASASYFGTLDFSFFDPEFEGSCDIQAMIGDSHAATFGEGCFEKGSAKVTLGTGSSIMVNTGGEIVDSNHGLLSTICYSTAEGVKFALEGAIVACGSTIEWLKNELGLFDRPEQTEDMAKSVPDNGGIYLIPAFSGLGAPHWQMDRRASIDGLTFGTGKNHIIRAALESIPFQIKDVVEAVNQDMKDQIQTISVNGGLSKNKFVLTFLVNLLNIPLNLQKTADVSALGAAYLAGLKSGIYQNINILIQMNEANSSVLNPQKESKTEHQAYQGWKERIQKK